MVFSQPARNKTRVKWWVDLSSLPSTLSSLFSRPLSPLFSPVHSPFSRPNSLLRKEGEMMKIPQKQKYKRKYERREEREIFRFSALACYVKRLGTKLFLAAFSSNSTSFAPSSV
eukprot:1232024-Amorphochlora_amoeboformis.AAC.1